MSLENVSSTLLYYQRSTKKGRRPYWKPNDYRLRHFIEQDGISRRTSPYFKEGEVNNGATCYRSFVNLTTEGRDRTSITNMRKLASNKALTKLDDELTIIESLFESWYERRQAYALATTAIREIVQFVTNWKNPRYWKKLGTGLKQPTALPEAWLAYGFGIKPLIGLLNDSMAGLATPLSTHTFKGTATVEYENSWAGNTSTVTPKGSNVYGKTKHMISYGCHAKPNLNPNYALANATGLNQPFSSAWSIAPWGWAVDYFVNVSELLSNIELKHPGVTVTDYYRTTTDTTSWYGHVGDPKKPDYRLDGSGYEMQRTVLTKPPLYQLTYDFPLLGSNQAAYLSSALAVTMKGKSK